MKKLILIFALTLLGCDYQPPKPKPQTIEVKSKIPFYTFDKDVQEFYIFEMDSCQYIYSWFGSGNGGGSFAHRGKCIYCQQRLEKTLKKFQY